MSKTKPAGDKPQVSVGDWPVFETRKQAVEVTKWPESLFKEIQKAGCPGFRHGRVYMAEVIPWLGQRGLEDAEIDWSRALKKEQTLRERIKRLHDEKESVGRTEVVFGLGKIEAAFFSQLERMQQELPASIKGCDEATVFKIFGARIAETKGELKMKFQALAEGQEL